MIWYTKRKGREKNMSIMLMILYYIKRKREKIWQLNKL
jgi:hypothetical protein